MDYIGNDQDLLLSLQDDFNMGEPFDMSIYNEQLSMLSGAMGIDSNQALEAILVTDDNMEQAIQYVFQNDQQMKLQMRSEAVIKKGMSLLTYDQMSDVMLELEQLRRDYRSMWLSRINLESFHLDHQHKHKLFLYQEFLRGITITRFLSVRRLEKIDEYRKENEITEDDHKECLLAIGISEEMFEKMKDTQTAPSRFACVRCYQKQKEYVMLECMHLCLCGDCVEDWRSKGVLTCPVCKTNVRQVRRIYRS